MAISFGLTMNATKYFVDRPLIRKLVKQGTASALPRIGAFLRRRARTRLRRRKRVSLAGESPSVHSADDIASLKNILFAVDRAGNRVLCGPVKLHQVNMVADVGSQSVPQIMEFGGVVHIHEVRRVQVWRPESYEWRRRDLRRNPREGDEYRIRRAVYRPRPFMGPALAAEIAAGTIPQSLSGVVRAT